MDRSPPRTQRKPAPTQPPVGKVSEFLGSRLLLLGVLASLLGLALLGYDGFKVWQLATSRKITFEIAQVVVLGALAFALLSVGESARRTGLRYLRGHKAMSRDLMGFVARRMARRSR